MPPLSSILIVLLVYNLQWSSRR